MSVPQPGNSATVDLLGREFHQFSVQNGVYLVPVDETEEERLNEFHDILKSWVSIGRIVLPDVGSTEMELNDVLDCGCGSGIWGDQVSEEYDCDITSIDLSKPREYDGLFQRWNLNAPFELCQQDWASLDYDLINSRCLTGGIDSARWPGYVGDLYDRLKPGGWLQMTEAYMNIQSDSGRGSEIPSISAWWDLYRTALVEQGRDPRVGTNVQDPSQRAWRNLKTLMTDAGFVSISEEQHRLPIGEWAEDPNSRYVGARVLVQARAMIESLSVWACRRVHGMTADEFSRLVDGCIEEMQTPGLKLYIPLYLVWGKKAPTGYLNGGSETNPHTNGSSQSMEPPDLDLDDLAVQPIRWDYGNRR